MTDQERNERRERKLREKYPGISGDVVQMYRKRRFHRRCWTVGLLAVVGVILVAVGLTSPDDRILFALGGFCVLYLALWMIPRREKAVEKKTLTRERIARDCAKKKRKAEGAWTFLGLDAVTALGYGIFEGWSSFVGGYWVPCAAVAAVCLLVILLKAWASRKLEKRILSGDFYLVDSPLNEKIVESSVGEDASDTYYFYFNVTAFGARYSYKTDYVHFSQHEKGELFYLILQKNRKGKEVPVFIYPAKDNPVDRELEEILKRDVHLTGEKISLDEEKNREIRQRAKAMMEKDLADLKEACEKAATWSEDERKANRRRLIRLIKLEGFLETAPRIANILLLPISLILAKAGLVDAPWYWDLLYTVGYLLICFAPKFAVSRLQNSIRNHQFLALASKDTDIPEIRNGRWFILLFSLSMLAGMANVISLLIIWGILS